MHDPIAFYRSFQELLRSRSIRALLTSGMACVEYGLQQNTKDTDWILDPGGIAELVGLFGDLERGVSGAPTAACSRRHWSVSIWKGLDEPSRGP